MPTYRAQCPVCKTATDFIRRIAERDDTPVCCDGKMERIQTTVMVPRMGLGDHYTITGGDGRTYYGKHEYQKYLDANGLLPASELKGEAAYQRKNIEAERKESLRKDVIDAVTSFS